MVGAKQFAIMRKIIEDKKENPIVKNIRMPLLKKEESKLHKLKGNLFDKYKFDSQVLAEIKKPIQNDEILPKKEVDNFLKRSGNFLDKFNFNPKHLDTSDKTTLKPKIKPITEAKRDDVDKSSINKKVNPLVQNISTPLSVMKSSDIRKFSEGLFDKFTSLSKIITKSQKPIEPQVIKEENSKEEDKKEISEEVLNRLTYDVFQNIRSYLEHHPINKPQAPERSKHIKLEITL